MLNPLITSLEELVTVHEQLVQTSVKKTSILIDGNIDALSQLIQEESKLVRQLGKLEEERMFQINQFLSGKGISTEEISLAQLLVLIPSTADREKVKVLADQLQEKIFKLKQHNELNAKLIQDSLAYVNQSIELFTDSDPDQMNYQAPLKGKGTIVGSGRRFFDTKA